MNAARLVSMHPTRRTGFMVSRGRIVGLGEYDVKVLPDVSGTSHEVTPGEHDDSVGGG